MMRCTGGEHKAIFEAESAIKSIIIMGLLVVSTGCTSQPTVGPPVYIKQTVYIPVPATLTQPISVDLTGATWGKAVGSLKAGLDTCNAKLDAISGLRVPPTPAPPKP